MDKRLPVLKVHLFGIERITYGDTPVFGGRSKLTEDMFGYMIRKGITNL